MPSLPAFHQRFWRVDETYIQSQGKWKYLYRAVDSFGNPQDFILSAKREQRAAQRFFRKAFKASDNSSPPVINLEQNAAYPQAINELKAKETIAKTGELRQNKYLNHIVEQDHRLIKRLVNPGVGFKSFHTARRTLSGDETMNMIPQGQSQGIEKGDIQAQVKFIAQIFGVAA